MKISQITEVSSCASGLQQHVKFGEDLNYPGGFNIRKHKWTLCHLKLFSYDLPHL